MTPEEILADLGITLPEPPAAVAAYVPWIRSRGPAEVAHQLSP